MLIQMYNCTLSSWHNQRSL
uniref:Uncharacterized protein n=1 Tax=Anguilla anguilla TaxID=7936 RepID=A0A0E9TX23_ANGAN